MRIRYRVPKQARLLRFSKITDRRLQEIRKRVHDEFQDHGSEAIDAGLLAAYEAGIEHMRVKWWEQAVQTLSGVPDPQVYRVPWPAEHHTLGAVFRKLELKEGSSK